jgi:hypothetical protein
MDTAAVPSQECAASARTAVDVQPEVHSGYVARSRLHPSHSRRAWLFHVEHRGATAPSGRASRSAQGSSPCPGRSRNERRAHVPPPGEGRGSATVGRGSTGGDRDASVRTAAGETAAITTPLHFPLLYSRHPMNAEGCRGLQEPFQACRLRVGWALRPWASHLLGRQTPHTSREAEAVRPLWDAGASGGWVHAPWTPLASLRGVSRETASEMPSPLSLLGEGRVASGRGIATTAPMYGPQRRVRRPLHQR